MSRSNLKYLLLWVSIIYGGSWLNRLFLIFLEGTYFRYLFMDFASPFILFLLFAGIFLISDRETQFKLRSSAAIKFFIVPLVFMLLEAIHFPNSYTIFTKTKYIFYLSIVSTSLSMCFLLAIFELSLKELMSKRFFQTLITLISLKAIIAMSISMLAINRILQIETNEILYNNGQAYESLTIVFLLLFYKRMSLNIQYRHVFLFLNSLPIFAFQCRGAALIFCFIYGIWFIRAIYRKSFINEIKTLALSSIIFILSIAYLAGFNAFNYLYGLIPSKDIYGRTQISHLMNLLSIIKNLLSTDSNTNQIMLLNNYGEFLSDATISAYARIGSIMMAFTHFLNYPFIGKGAYAAHALNIEGYGIHSLLPLILASYGLFGFLPFILYCLHIMKKSINANHNYFNVFTSSFYVVLVMTFTNAFVWWYSLIIIFMRYLEPEPNQIQ